MKTPIYEGSVKNLWTVDLTTLEFEYTDAYSVFDWGRMPDLLQGKGTALASIGEFFFKQISQPAMWKKIADDARITPALRGEFEALCAKGMLTHFKKRTAPNKFTVEKVKVVRPEVLNIFGREVVDYSSLWFSRPHLIPLEVVFRFGAPSGSSFFERATPQYCREVGLKEEPAVGARFPNVVIEFFSKLENKDRFLTFEQAYLYTRLDDKTFGSLIARSMLLSFFLDHFFKEIGLELWDGKFEWALSADGEVMLVDSIGPDELRLLDPTSGVQLSKEFLRQFYRPTPWFEKVTSEKKKGGDWKERVGVEPPKLSAQFLEVSSCLYPSLAFWITGHNPDGHGVSLSKMREMVALCSKN